MAGTIEITSNNKMAQAYHDLRQMFGDFIRGCVADYLNLHPHAETRITLDMLKWIFKQYKKYMLGNDDAWQAYMNLLRVAEEQLYWAYRYMWVTWLVDGTMLVYVKPAKEPKDFKQIRVDTTEVWRFINELKKLKK